MTECLLDRQVRLLEYLTSNSAIFGDENDALLDPALQGIDRRMLRLEARFSHGKRMAKIIAVFPQTFQLLGAERAAIVCEFVEACPPISITRLYNARQFYEFLCARWQHRSSEPPYLRDVAACEFAYAKARVGAEARVSAAANGERTPQAGIRRHPDIAMLRCAYDIRPIFEAGSGHAAPVERDTPLVVAVPPNALYPKVFEVLPPVFDVLAVIDDWTDRSLLGATPEVDELVRDLAEHGLVEVHG
jgi:hypothetical protein